MQQPPIKKVEFSKFFWKNMSDWRQHPDILNIRKNMADVVQKRARGEFGGDVAFKGGNHLDGILHCHVGNKLTLFTAYPEPGVMRLVALTKHDFYGFGKERARAVTSAVTKLRNAIAAESVVSPEWGNFSWSKPSDIAGHPEIRELSIGRLSVLSDELMEEAEDFTKFRRACKGMSDSIVAEAFDSWCDDLIVAQDIVSNTLLELSQNRKAYLKPEDLAHWSP